MTPIRITLGDVHRAFDAVQFQVERLKTLQRMEDTRLYAVIDTSDQFRQASTKLRQLLEEEPGPVSEVLLEHLDSLRITFDVMYTSTCLTIAVRQVDQRPEILAHLGGRA